jgi:hypothetical protein
VTRGVNCNAAIPKNNAMTTKEKILTEIKSLDDDVSIEQAIDRLYLLRNIEIGVQQANADQGIEHDEFMKQLEDVEAN